MIVGWRGSRQFCIEIRFEVSDEETKNKRQERKGICKIRFVDPEILDAPSSPRFARFPSSSSIAILPISFIYNQYPAVVLIWRDIASLGDEDENKNFCI